MSEIVFFVIGVIVGLILGSVVYEFFTFPIIRVVFKRHRDNNE